MSQTHRLVKLFDTQRLPVILQSEAAECGLTCLAMVANRYGHRIDLNTLRRRYPVSLNGIGLPGLMKLADRLQFATRALRLELDEIENLQCPAILHWDLNHFVVLAKAGRRSITVHDPARGRRTLSREEASKHFTGVALELVPTERFEVIISRDVGLLKVLAIGFTLLMLIGAGVAALRSLVIVNMSAQLNIQMASNLFRHLIRLPLSWFEKRHIGDVVSRFGSMDAIKSLLTDEIVSAVVDGVMLVGTLFMLFLYSPLLAAIVVGTALLYALFRLAVYRPFRRLTEEAIVAGAKEDSNFLETIRGAQSIKLFGHEAQRQTGWQNLYAEALNAGIRIDRLGIGYGTVNTVLFGLENVLVIYLAALLVIGNEMSVGMIFAFMAYKGQFTGKATSLIEQMIQLKMISLHLARLGDIVTTPAEDEGPQAANEPVSSEPIRGAISVRDLCFRYSETEPLILDGVNLEIEAGQSVCLIGPSGCGKSTLMKLMLGLLEPTHGTVLVDGMDVRQLGTRRYRESVASVMQNDQLLSGSIADNISFFDPVVDQKRIEGCATVAAIHTEIMRMPMAYHSLIGDMGTTLSGGQKQRILLARALYKRPRILFLDESTAHLDVTLEKRINGNLSWMRLTRIVIAHRPETINAAERVVRVTPTGCFERTGTEAATRAPSAAR